MFTGWTTNACPDEAQLKALGDKMREDILAVHGMDYTNQRIVDLYKATGGASDWSVNLMIPTCTC